MTARFDISLQLVPFEPDKPEKDAIEQDSSSEIQDDVESPQPLPDELVDNTISEITENQKISDEDVLQDS